MRLAKNSMRHSLNSDLRDATVKAFRNRNGPLAIGLENNTKANRQAPGGEVMDLRSERKEQRNARKQSIRNPVSRSTNNAKSMRRDCFISASVGSQS